MDKTLAIGVTGGIGSGKSEVCHIFGFLGATVLNADEIAKSLMETEPSVQKRLIRTFGSGVFGLDGKLNRHYLAEIVFNDNSAREKLNAIVHPKAIGAIKKEVTGIKKKRSVPMVLVEAALIYEAKAERLFDYIIVVNTDEKTRLDRLTEQNWSKRNEIKHRMKSQMSSSEKIKKADFIIINSGNRKELKKKCKFLYKIFKVLSGVQQGRL